MFNPTHGRSTMSKGYLGHRHLGARNRSEYWLCVICSSLKTVLLAFTACGDLLRSWVYAAMLAKLVRWVPIKCSCIKLSASRNIHPVCRQQHSRYTCYEHRDVCYNRYCMHRAQSSLALNKTLHRSNRQARMKKPGEALRERDGPGVTENKWRIHGWLTGMYHASVLGNNLPPITLHWFGLIEMHAPVSLVWNLS